MAELTNEQLQRQDKVDNAIHNLFQELLGNPIGDPLPWDIEKISRVRDAIQDAFDMTDEQRFAFYPWIPNPTGLQGPTGIPLNSLHKCDNCMGEFYDPQLNPIQDYGQRVEPGGVVPSGECPNCGALCYPLSAVEDCPSDSPEEL